MIRKYLLDKIKNGENGLKYILLKKDEKNILLSETKEVVKIEELGKEVICTLSSTQLNYQHFFL